MKSTKVEQKAMDGNHLKRLLFLNYNTSKIYI